MGQAGATCVAAALTACLVVAPGGATAQSESPTSRFEIPAGVPAVPDGWTKKELDRYLKLQASAAWQSEELQRSAVASKAMIAGTSEPLAIHAGLGVLEHGGNAADAALTTALAQIALSAGAFYSYAGILTALYFDAETRTTYSLNAAYDTVRGEKEPRSIPPYGRPSGRSALVPGFMAGVQALHDRFGSLPLGKLFAPAIWIAEHGVPFNEITAASLAAARPFMTRLPETSRIFKSEDGDFYKPGELFRQPELAVTLRKVTEQGAAYMYTGAWARRFVRAVQREGGKLAMDDLAAYRPLWAVASRFPYHDYGVASLGPPSIGGRSDRWAFGLAETADLERYAHYTRSADALYYLIQITRNALVLGRSALQPDEATLSWEWDRIRDGAAARPRASVPSPPHSAAIIAIDEKGNIAVVVHSSNTVLWGSTGLFVDGVSIPDSADLQQELVFRAGPGNRLPESVDPMIVFKGGSPVLASAAVGSSLHQASLENVLNILDFHMDPKTSVDTPNTQGPFLAMTRTGPGRANIAQETVAAGAFPQAVLQGVRDRGQAIRVLPASDRSQAGFWIGVQIDFASHELNGAVTAKSPALVEGY